MSELPEKSKKIYTNSGFGVNQISKETIINNMSILKSIQKEAKMNICQRLVGCPYPVKDIDGNILSYSPIKAATMCSNPVTVAIQLDETDVVIILGLGEAIKMLDKITKV
jgi:hypothetical protein